MRKVFFNIFSIVFLLHVAVIVGLGYVDVPFVGITGEAADYTEYQGQAEAVAERLSEGNFSVRGLLLDHYFPVFVGYLYFVFGSSMIVGQLFNGVVAGVSAILLFVLMRQIGGSVKASFISSVAASAYPTYLLFTSLFREDALAILFTLAALLAGLKALQVFNIKHIALWYGLLIAAAEFRSFLGLFLGVAFLLSFALLYSASWQEKVKKGFVILVLILLIPYIAELLPIVSGYGDYGHSLNPEIDYRNNANMLYTFIATLVGPFGILYAVEVIPWLAAIPFIVKGVKRAARPALSLAIFGMVVVAAIALSVEQEGMMMRLRVPAFLAFMAFLPLAFRSQTVFAQQENELCPVCKRLSQHTLITKRGEFELQECSACCAQFWEPFKNPGADWYEEGNTIVEPKIGRAYHKQFLKQFFVENKKVLDVGCGTGEFLFQAQKRGAEVWGIDIDTKALAFAKEQFHIQNLYTNFDFEGPQFDIITCFETIEHVDDPLGLMGSIAKKLKPDGVLVLSTPSRERMFANLNRWDFPYNHLSRWNTESLSHIGNLSGLQMQSLKYVEGFRFLMEGISGRFRSGLVKKASGVSVKKTALKLGKMKAYSIGGIPAVPLWLWGLITRRKNGTMFTIWKTKK